MAEETKETTTQKHLLPLLDEPKPEAKYEPPYLKNLISSSEKLEFDVLVVPPTKVVSVKMPVDLLERVDKFWRRRGYRSRSEFIIDAILFYMGYLIEKEREKKVKERLRKMRNQLAGANISDLLCAEGSRELCEAALALEELPVDVI